MSFSQLSVAEMLDELAAAGRAPRGLSAAAMTCALAASLVERVSSEDGSPFGVVRVARSSALRDRLVTLLERDGVTDPGAPEALAPERGGLPPATAGAGNARLLAASLAIASCAAQLTSLAAECAAGAPDEVVREAIVAAELSDGACRAAAHILRIGLSESPTDPRRTEAAGLVNASSTSLQEAFAEAAERETAA